MKQRSVKGKRIVAAMLAAVLALGSFVYGEMPVLAAGDVMKEFFVSPLGDDGNDGSKENPFLTIDRAREAAAGINDNMTGDILVNIAPGDYYMEETVNFGREDSASNGFDIVYQCTGAPGTARFIGGKRLEGGWVPADAGDVDNFDLPGDMVGKVYKVALEGDIPDFNTLYINDKRATMARTMNRYNSERFIQSDDEYMYATGGELYGIYYDKSVLPESAVKGIDNALKRGEEGAQVYGWDWGYHNWFTSTLPVSRIDTQLGRLYFTPDPENPASNRPKYTFTGGARFYLQGNLSFLDSPGEYHYNKKTGILYYYPGAGEENMNQQEVIVPILQELFHLEGNEKEKLAMAPDPKEQVHNITFRGIMAGYTEFTDSYSSGWNAFDAQGGIGRFPEEALQEGITNPSFCEQTDRAEFQKGAFTFIQTNHITLDQVKINYTGMSGVVIWTDNNDITIQNSEIAYNGFNGITIDGGYPGPETGKYSYNMSITNNVLHDVGELVGHGTCLAIMQTHDSEFSHMEMYNAPRRAVFLTAGWARRRPEDADFDRYRDSATYENRLEYLYLHDLQQDGGDDGAIFLCTLYRYQNGPGDGFNDTKPNYLNQIYMDNIGAAPSTKDFKPNCINFDMGCGGVVASNIKAVNPQHYNIRYDEGKDMVTFRNVNMAYYHPMEDSNYTNFDESLMEYDKIGVNGEYPYDVPGRSAKTYEDVYYREEFDKGLEDWWSLAGKPGVSPLYYSDNDDFGGNSFLADAFYNSSKEGCLIGKPFGVELNKIVEIDFFDHMNDGMEDGYCGMRFQYRLNSFARVDDGVSQRAIGADHGVSDKYYSYKIGSIAKATDIPREYGWHTFRWDYTSGTQVGMYIDGRLIATAPAESFQYIEMGDYGMGGFNAYDNVVIYGGDPAGPPLPLPAPPDKEEPEVEDKTLPGRIEAEEADKLPDSVVIEDSYNGGKAIAYISKGDIYEYDIMVSEDMELPFTVVYAANNQEGSFRVAVDGEEKLTVLLPPTGGWSKYREITLEDKLMLTQGEHKLEIHVVKDGFNLDSFGALPPREQILPRQILTDVQGTLILGKGDVVRIPYQVLPEEAEDKSVVWETDGDGQIVSVSGDGAITASAEGKAEITVASVSNPQCKTVIPVEVKDVEKDLISKPELGCMATANVPEDHIKYVPDKLIDGDIKIGWNAIGASKPGGREDPSAYLSWEQEQTVETIYLYDIPEAGNFVKKLEIIFNDDPGDKILLEEGVPDGGMSVVTLPEVRTDVSKIEFHILEADAQYKNYGFAEIKVFSGQPGKVPVNGISFGLSQITLFPGGTYTLKPPVVVPSSATNTKLSLSVEEGGDVIRLEENSMDGIIKNYTIHALKLGRAVIRAEAEGGVTADFTVTVGSREQLENKIIEAEELLGKYPGSTPAHEALKKVIGKAVAVYNTSKDLEEYGGAVEELEEAMKVFLEAAASDMTAQEIADSITLTHPARGQDTLEKPQVPLGYKVSVKSSAPEGIIRRNWSIAIPDEDLAAEVTVQVTRISDNTTGEKTCTINIPGYGPEDVLEQIEIPQPLKKQDKLELPVMPWGFAVSVESSTDNRIAPDGTISLPLQDTEVTAKIRVTKAANGSIGDKDFVFLIPGIGKPLGVPIEANEIDQVYGSTIMVKDNEVVNFNSGNWIRYDNVDFGEEEKEIQVSLNLAVHPDLAGKKIRIMLDRPDGEELGTITAKAGPDGGGQSVYNLHQVRLSGKLSGIHSIYLVGAPDDNGQTEGIGRLKELLFEEAAPVYTITVQEGIENGTVSPDKSEAREGETVSLTVSANDGWYLAEGSLKVNDGRVEVKDQKFIMPGENVTVTAVFVNGEKFSVRISQDLVNGSVTPDKTEAACGEEVTLSVSAGDGYHYVEDSLRANEGRIPIKNGKFIMPEEDVLVTASFEPNSPEIFQVRINAGEGGSVWASPMWGILGDVIQLTVQPDEGWRLTEGSIKVNEGAVAVSADRSFIMPGEDVIVQAAFEPIPSYGITVAEGIADGTVTTDKSQAREGEEVTVTVLPREGFRLTEGSLKINEGSVPLTDYKFYMPAGEVMITAAFEKLPEEPRPPQPSEEQPQTPEEKPQPPREELKTPEKDNKNTGKKPKASGKKNTGTNDEKAASQPVLKEKESVTGWDNINKELEKMKDGESVTIGLKESTILPGRTLEAIKGRDVLVNIEIEDGFTWSFRGTNVTGKSLRDINLMASWEKDIIPEEVTGSLTAAEELLQLRLAHEGEFCAVMTLHLKLDQKYAGSYANLCFYNPEKRSLEYVTNSLISENGTTSLDMTHASDYAVIIDTRALDQDSLNMTVKIPVNGLRLSRETLELEIGESAGLEAFFEPEDASDTGLIFTSSHQDIATADEKGNITAISPGEAIITVTTSDGGFTAQCKVIVREAAKEAASDQIQPSEDAKGNFAVIAVSAVILLLAGIGAVAVKKKQNKR